MALEDGWGGVWEGAWRSPCQSPAKSPGAAGSTASPTAPSLGPRAAEGGVPSLPIPLPGLPDEAFESLTQLQHIYVAHNKVSTPT